MLGGLASRTVIPVSSPHYGMAFLRRKKAVEEAVGNGLLNNLIAHWKLDEASGSRADSHTNGLTLTDNNTVGQGTGKVYSNVADFEIINSEYLSRASEALLLTGDIDFSFDVWVKRESTSGASALTVFEKGNSGAFEYWLRWNRSADRWEFRVTNDGSTFTNIKADSFGAVSNAVWYYIACGHSASGNAIWISVNDGTVDTAAHTTGVYTGTDGFAIGARIGPSSYFDGLIGPVNFWKTDIRGDKLATLYNSGSGLAFSQFEN